MNFLLYRLSTFSLVGNSINLNQTVLRQSLYSEAHSCWVFVLLEILSIDSVELNEESHISKKHISLSYITECQPNTSKGCLQVLHNLVSLSFNLLRLNVAWFRVDRDLTWHKNCWSHNCHRTVRTDGGRETFWEYSFDWIHLLVEKNWIWNYYYCNGRFWCPIIALSN